MPVENEEKKREENDVEFKPRADGKQPKLNRLTMNQLMDETRFNMHEYKEIVFSNLDDNVIREAAKL